MDEESATSVAPMEREDSDAPTTEECDAHTTQHTIAMRNKRKRSMVWSYFTLEKINGEDKAICNHCKTPLTGKSTSGTSHLRDHYERCAKHQVSKEFVFDEDVTKNKIARMIILHGYPLSVVDHCGFRDVLTSFNPSFKVPSRNSIKKEIFNIYDYEKGTTIKMLESNKSRIALTTDMWTANNLKKGFMTITSHFIDDKWELQSRIIRFVHVPCPHTSDVLATMLYDCMIDWNLEGKLSTLTVDNCTTNDAIVRNLLEKLPISSLICDGKLFHMRCCAHILNIIVQDGLSVMKVGIEKVRDTVAYWSSSPKRVQKFEEASRKLEIECTKKLSLDCKTRWNSTYLMLMVALQCKKVFSRLEIREYLFYCCPTNEEWDQAEEICDKLKTFYDVTKAFSGSKYLTANIFFPLMCKIKFKLSSWRLSSSELIRSMALSMDRKFDKYWNNIHGVMTIAMVLDPRYKLKYLEFQFLKLYGDESSFEVDKVKTLCSELVEDYQSREPKGSKQQNTSIGALEEDDDDDDYASFQRYAKKSNYGGRSELDQYLDEMIIPKNTEGFDIMTFWKDVGGKWPTLQKIARDILAIPISTVASESAFSYGGKAVSPHRSRLCSDTLEVLMCTQSWLWGEKGTSPEEMDAQDVCYEEEDDEV